MKCFFIHQWYSLISKAIFSSLFRREYVPTNPILNSLCDFYCTMLNIVEENTAILIERHAPTETNN